MGLYQMRVMPALLDWTCGLSVLTDHRRRLLPLAEGRVLEVGIGTGLNLPYYDADRVERLWGLDPGVELQSRARARLEQTGLDLELIGLSGEEIPMDARSFDTVVVTYTLCTIPDVRRALGEMRRVLKPGGRLLFSEHGLAPEPRVQRWQHRLTPLWRSVAGGCHLNRDVPALLDESGFRIRRLEQDYLPRYGQWLKPLAFNSWGVAEPQ